MRIVSKFRDYYDGVRGIDRDDEPLYVREQQVFDLARMDTLALRALRAKIEPIWTDATVPPASPLLAIERFVIGFCGRAIGMYRVSGRAAYDLAAVIDALDDLDISPIALGAAHRWYRYAPRASDAPLNGDSWNRYILRRNENVGDAAFIALGAPIVVLSDRHVVVNAMLRDFAFASRFDPYAVWQELSMYLANNLADTRGTEPRPISDELKAHAHGFDGTSFRNTRNRPRGDRSDW